MKLCIRVVDPREAPAVAALLDTAFEGAAESRLVTCLRADEDSWIPELSLGAFDGDLLVGYVMLTRVLIGEQRTEALSLAPLAVAPGVQRCGIGGLLTGAALGAARRRGERIVVVLGHPEYYPRFGFVPAAERGIRAPWDVPDDAWMVLELVEGAADGVTGEVAYPSPFHEAL